MPCGSQAWMLRAVLWKGGSRDIMVLPPVLLGGVATERIPGTEKVPGYFFMTLKNGINRG